MSEVLTRTIADLRPTPRTSPPASPVDREALIAMLHEKDQHIQELEAECRGLAEQLMAFQTEILKWVELDR